MKRNKGESTGTFLARALARAGQVVARCPKCGSELSRKLICPECGRDEAMHRRMAARLRRAAPPITTDGYGNPV